MGTNSLAQKGFSVVRGLALGCDTRAHIGALSVQGHTTAVLGHGLDMVFPQDNKNLAEEIVASNGLLISTYHIGEKPTYYTFASRDKIQAGLSEYVVMVQSSSNGGSLNAARATLEEGRILVVPKPTQRDIDHKEKSIEANISLINSKLSGSFIGLKDFEVKTQSKLDNYLSHIRILNDQTEYPNIFDLRNMLPPVKEVKIMNSEEVTSLLKKYMKNILMSQLMGSK
ncbi:MAG: DNA-processing protein DprA [Succinivibrio sp.]